MKETLRNKEVFEYYYALGESRNYRELVQKFNISLTTMANWGKAFNWQERVVQRDIEISKGLEKKTNTTILNEKANYRRIIKEAIKGMGDIKVLNPKDLDTLVKLDLLLMGEATEKTEAKVDLSHLSIDQLRELIEYEDTGSKE